MGAASLKAWVWKIYSFKKNTKLTMYSLILNTQEIIKNDLSGSLKTANSKKYEN